MRYGIIKRLWPQRGFGFIGQEGGPDVFFHATRIGPDVFRQLRRGQPVMFELEQSPTGVGKSARRRWQAVQVVRIDRIPGGKLPLVPRELTPRRHPRALGRKASWKRKIELRREDSA